MRHLTAAAFVSLLLCAGCSTGLVRDVDPVGGERLPAVGSEVGQPYATNVIVILKLKHYVVGWIPLEEPNDVLFLNKPDDDYRREVDGFVLEIIEPPKYAGWMIGAHYDGAGFYDPYSYYKMGVRYKEEVRKSAMENKRPLRPSICR